MLLYEIDNLFGHVKKPDRHQLGARGTEEWACTLNHLHTRTWRQVTLEDFDSQDGVAGTISVLSKSGFIYFLPGLLRLALTTPDGDERYVIVSALVDVFTRPDYLAPDIENTAKLKTLSPEQRGWLIRFLEEVRKGLPTLYPIVIDAAIASLKAGETIPHTSTGS